MVTAQRNSARPEAGRQRATPDRSTLRAVGAIAAVGGLLSLLGSAAPTSWGLADALWRVAVVVLCTFAGSRSRRWALLWGSVVTLAATGWWTLPFAVLATIGAASMLVIGFRDRILGAAIGAAIGLTALNLVRPTTTGATAAVAAVALAPMLVSAHRLSRTHVRRRTWFGVLAIIAMFVLGAAGAAAMGTGQRDDIDAAVEATRDAVAALGDDDSEEARDGFVLAAERFEAIHSATGAPWFVPARLTPVIGSNLNMARQAAAVGMSLNRAADELSRSIDQESLRHPAGGVDLAVLATMQEPVGNAIGEATSSMSALRAVDSPWLIRPASRALDELLDELDNMLQSARLAGLAFDRLPDLLGADGPRRYIMLLGNPAETRDIGGHIGNWAELRVEDGDFELVELGQPYELVPEGTDQPPTLDLESGRYPRSLIEMRPQYHPQNWGSSPDLPTVAFLTADLFPQVRPGPPVDGVLYADPFAFAALLNFTGDTTVPGTDIRLNPDNAAEFLLQGQFSAFETEHASNQALNALIDEVLSDFSGSQLPSPRRVIEVLGPIVEQGRLQFASLHPQDDLLLKQVGLRGGVERPGAGDLLAVMTRNSNPSKIDIHLSKEVTYDVQWDPATGAVEAELDVQLTNDAPSSGLPKVVANPIPGLDPATNRTSLTILSPFEVSAVTVDGEPVGIGTQQEMRGVWRHSVLLDIPGSSTRTVSFQLAGSVGAEAPYLLEWIGHPGPNPSGAAVTIQPTGEGIANGEAPHTFSLDERDQRLTIPIPR